MNKLGITLLLLFSCMVITTRAQLIEATYSPASSQLWGQTPGASKTNLSVLLTRLGSGRFRYTPGLRYSYVNASRTDGIDHFNDPIQEHFHMLFLIPAAFQYEIGTFDLVTRFGIGWSDTSFPNENGLHSNILLEAGLNYTLWDPLGLTIRYSHISNGYRGETNPGLDNITLGAVISL